jgi:hypothetical protein
MAVSFVRARGATLAWVRGTNITADWRVRNGLGWRRGYRPAMGSRPWPTPGGAQTTAYQIEGLRPGQLSMHALARGQVASQVARVS